MATNQSTKQAVITENDVAAAGSLLAGIPGMKLYTAGSAEHTQESSKRDTTPREAKFAALRAYAQKNGGSINGVPAENVISAIQTMNANNVPVRAKIGNVNYLFQPTKTEQKAQAQAAAEETKKGFWERNAWLKWVLIGLGTVGLGVLAYYLGRRAGKKKAQKASDPTKEPTPTDPSPTTTDGPTPTPTGILDVIDKEPAVDHPTAAPTSEPVVEPTAAPTSNPLDQFPTVDPNEFDPSTFNPDIYTPSTTR